MPKTENNGLTFKLLSNPENTGKTVGLLKLTNVLVIRALFCRNIFSYLKVYKTQNTDTESDWSRPRIAFHIVCVGPRYVRQTFNIVGRVVSIRRINTPCVILFMYLFCYRHVIVGLGLHYV